MMTSRERLLETIRGKQPDRIAVAPFVHSSTVNAWEKDPAADPIDGTISYCKHFGFDTILRNFNIRHNDLSETTNRWEINSFEEIQGNTTIRTTRIETPGGVLRQKTGTTALTPFLTVNAIVEHFIKSPDDFKLFLRYQPPPQPPDLQPLIRAKQAIGENGILAPWTWGVFNYLSEMRSLDQLLTDPSFEPEFYESMANYFKERLQQALVPVLEEGVDFLSYTGNVASSSLVGPRFFNKFIYSYEKELIDWIQTKCYGIIYHNCGDGSKLIDCYNRISPVCYESMTEAPFADNSLEQCSENFSQNITLIGNIDQIDFLKKATPDEVKKRALNVMQIMKKHPRFILGTSDFIEDNTPEENLFALSESVRESS
jgi:hypothetical protein